VLVNKNLGQVAVRSKTSVLVLILLCGSKNCGGVAIPGQMLASINKSSKEAVVVVLIPIAVGAKAVVGVVLVTSIHHYTTLPTTHNTAE